MGGACQPGPLHVYYDGCRVRGNRCADHGKGSRVRYCNTNLLRRTAACRTVPSRSPCTCAAVTPRSCGARAHVCRLAGTPTTRAADDDGSDGRGRGVRSAPELVVQCARPRCAVRATKRGSGVPYGRLVTVNVMRTIGCAEQFVHARTRRPRVRGRMLLELRAHTALGIRRRRIHRILHAAQRAVDVNKKKQVRTACPSLLRKHQIRALTTRSRV